MWQKIRPHPPFPEKSEKNHRPPASRHIAKIPFPANVSWQISFLSVRQAFHFFLPDIIEYLFTQKKGFVNVHYP
jgi:hypothetical protein